MPNHKASSLLTLTTQHLPPCRGLSLQFGDALMVLFITCSLNGYTVYMIAAMSAPKMIGDQPQLNSNWAAFFYFAAFVLVCALILINLYTGVIFSQFTRLSEQAQVRGEGGRVDKTFIQYYGQCDSLLRS